jgi:hypothetical protein
LLLALLFACAITKQEEMGDMEKKAIAIGRDHIVRNYKFVDVQSLKPTLEDKGDYWQFYYDLPDYMQGGTPVIHIDKRSFKIIRSYMTQ